MTCVTVTSSVVSLVICVGAPLGDGLGFDQSIVTFTLSPNRRNEKSDKRTHPRKIVFSFLGAISLTRIDNCTNLSRRLQVIVAHYYIKDSRLSTKKLAGKTCREKTQLRLASFQWMPSTVTRFARSLGMRSTGSHSPPLHFGRGRLARLPNAHRRRCQALSEGEWAGSDAGLSGSRADGKPQWSDRRCVGDASGRGVRTGRGSANDSSEMARRVDAGSAWSDQCGSRQGLRRAGLRDHAPCDGDSTPRRSEPQAAWRTAERHTSAEFASFLEPAISGCKRTRRFTSFWIICPHTRPIKCKSS